MNSILLEMAAEFAVSYQTSYLKTYGKWDAKAAATLQQRITKNFGAIYALRVQALMVA